MNREIKHYLLNNFNELYPNCEALAFQLDGFTHQVYFIDKKDYKVKKESTSNYMSACESSAYPGFTERARKLFKGLSNCTYQNNAKEFIIHEPYEIPLLIQEYKSNKSFITGLTQATA